MKDEVEQAIERVQAGDTQAYGHVVDAYQRQLRASLAGKCPPSVDADEIAHLAFIEAYRQIDRYRLGTQFYAWLWVIARNLLRAEIKKASRRFANENRLLEHWMATRAEAELDHGDEEGDARFLSAFRDCLQALPEASRRLLSLRHVEDMSLVAMSEAEGRSVSALKFQLFATRKVVRECVRGRLSRGES